MLICLAKRQMHSRITIIGSIPKLLHINFWPSKMRLKSKRKLKLWKTRRMRIKMILRKPMISVIQYRTNSTPLKTMFRRWSACSLKPNSTQTLLASNLMTMKRNSMSKISGTTLLNSKNIFLTSLWWWLIRKRIQMQLYHRYHLRDWTRRNSTKEISLSMLLTKQKKAISQANQLKRVTSSSIWMMTTSSILRLFTRTSLIL